nr:DUF2400 family protein [Bacteroides sp. UBA939]
MTEDTKNKLWKWAVTCHCADFIQNAPVQFPHRYHLKQDVEISGLPTAIMSFDNPKQILKNARRITDALAAVFPDNPCLGDFALFGYGVNNKQGTISFL